MTRSLSTQPSREALLDRLTAKSGYFGINLERAVAELAVDMIVGHAVDVLDTRGIDTHEQGFHMSAEFLLRELGGRSS